MLSINLKAQDEYQWRGEENPSPATFPKGRGWYPLYHQWRTYNAEKPIIVNTYNTGTGKTKAALLRLLKRARDIGFEKLTSSRHNALLIAPTNELLAQHVEDAIEFCQENDLPYQVLALTRPNLDDYKNRPGFSEDQLRRIGPVLHSILNDVSKVSDDLSKRATLYVVNPDIFYYAVLFCYSPFDRAALFKDFFGLFNYIIIDEFHYYNPKQLTAFLFFMKLSQHNGYIDSSAKKRQICILTATPRPQVTEYLNGLGIPIEWIRPGEIDPVDVPSIQPVRALTSIQLQVYHTEELQQGDAQGGLLQLAQQQQDTIRSWLDQGFEGAIISSSLGTVNRIRKMLLPKTSDAVMGRITGAELREGREEAKEKALILATPTVDIGYNFNRSRPKSRQNIDFLLLDAYSGDELVQRIGRAGRVLAVDERDHPSFVIVAVDPIAYKLLQEYDGKELERSELARIADSEEMPKRNDLYAYIKTGAILEVIRPITFIGQGTPTENMPNLETFLQDIQKLFGVKRPFSYRDAQSKVRKFEDRKKHYGELKTIPQEALDILRLKIEGKPFDAPQGEIEKCVKAFIERLSSIRKPVGRNGREVVQWLQCDLRDYFVDQARFSFRDSFQPPLALLYDPEHLHSSEDSRKGMTLYNALHIAKYYEARYFASVALWEKHTEAVAKAESKNALAFCHLLQFRDTPLQIGLKLNANEYTHDEWEEQFAYQVTALYGLEVVALNDDRGLDPTLQALFRTQFIPAFAAFDNARSSTASVIRHLRRQARFFPVQMKVTFCDGKTLTYLVILGAMAFQVCAEIPYRTIAIDRRKTQLEDDAPFIC